MATHKALEMAQFLKEELAFRLPGIAVADVAMSGTDPWIQIGTGGIGAAGGVVKIIPTSWALATDVLGNAANQYVPHTIQVSFEANPAGGGGADINTFGTILSVLGACVVRGTKVMVYTTANGVAPAPGALGTLRGSFESLQYPMISSQ